MLETRLDKKSYLARQTHMWTTASCSRHSVYRQAWGVLHGSAHGDASAENEPPISLRSLADGIIGESQTI